MPSSLRLMDALASGHFVSGEALAARMGITRAAVWKQVAKLRRRGIPIDAVRGRGYRMHGGTPLLDHDRIMALLTLPVRTRLATLEVLLEVPSTNTWLLERTAPQGPMACVAEWQTAGRGRRGRSWQAPFGSSICLSLAYPFTQLPPGFGGLGLVAGVAIVDALVAAGYAGIGLKWPNDLVLDGAKLGGLLVESRSEAGGTTRVVVGVGINWKLPAGGLGPAVEGPVTDLAAQPVPLQPRDALVGSCINHLMTGLAAFAEHGLVAFRERWARLDILAGREVEVIAGSDRHRGRADGIDEEGALRVVVADSIRRFTSGEVSVREGR